MSDYMRGYNSRNRRRRNRYERRYHATGRRAYRARQRSRRGVNPVVTWGIRIGIAVVLIVAVIVGLKFFAGSKDGGSTPQKTVENPVAATGGAVTMAAVANGNAPTTTVEPGGLAEIAGSVKKIPANAIATPAPKVRSKAVALTFDDGPSTSFTNNILDIMEQYGAHATFFVVGERVESGADILKREIALGCEIGSHSWDHANLSKLSIKGVNKQNGRTAKLIKKLTGYEIKTMRPPYGAISDTMRKKMKFPMILWSVDTLDWKSRNAKAVLKEVKKQVSDGDIILVHDIHESTAEAMKTVIPWLVQNDYDILTVSELMERKGIKMKNGTAYGSAH